MRYAGDYELRYSAKGHPYRVRKRKKSLPRIDDRLLDSVVYIYSSREDAERTASPGGSGFLFCIPYEGYDNEGPLYVVTNRHVVFKAGASPVIRLNTHDGQIDTLLTRQDDWVYHQDGDDLAVCELDIDPSVFDYACLHPSLLLTQEDVKEHNMGPGDEVFMVGRFIDHEGHQRNTPSARFGHISMMPGEPVYNPERQMSQVSFLVEMLSIGGFSGAPVFVYIPLFTFRPGEEMPTQAMYGPWLLGVSWGHFQRYEGVVYKDDKEQLVDGNYVVPSNSGQAGVVPAWQLQELLDQEELVVARKRAEDEFRKKIADSPFVLDSQTTDHEGSDVFTEDDFEDALDRVSQRESPPDQEN